MAADAKASARKKERKKRLPVLLGNWGSSWPLLPAALHASHKSVGAAPRLGSRESGPADEAMLVAIEAAAPLPVAGHPA